ncbi:hypothetical protein JCM24511_07099 [Saitozyma sp. JCM 24511]|nr:hypothetical protein JCM24511_07099 [Saitozyma sp. JCM 24511]
MVSSLYPSLHTSLLSLSQSTSTQRSPHYSSVPLPPVLPPIPPEQLKSAVQGVWTPLWSDFTGAQSLEGAKRGEVVRGVMDLVGRELAVTPIVHEELAEPLDESDPVEHTRFQTELQDRLDLVLTLYEVVYEAIPDAPSLEPGAVFIPLLEELVELISVDSWRTLWGYIETRSKRFTKDMPASKGKALPILRTINAFLRFLPRTPADLIFRGRVHQFASSVISVADKSAINMRGDYNDVKTTWEEQAVVGSSEDEEVKAAEAADEGGAAGEENGDGSGDVQMGEEVKEESKDVEASTSGETSTVKSGSLSFAETPKPAEPDFYSTLWSLQQYFASPPTLDGPPTGEPPHTPFDDFKTKSDFVLPRLFEQTRRENEIMGKDTEMVGSKRKRDVDDGGFFHPRYLTGKRLLEHELADPSFRRQILVQYFILFQFLLNLTPASASKQAFTGGMPKTFVLDSDNEVWVKGKVATIREELRKMVPDGTRFEDTVLSIITRERHYAQWKNDGCPENVFEIPPLDTTTAEEAAELWQRRLEPPPQWPFKLGTRPLSKLWNRGFRDINQLKSWRRQTSFETLNEELQRIVADEEDDKAMGLLDPEKEKTNKATKIRINWRALRHARQTELRFFGALAKSRDITILSKVKEAEAARMAGLSGDGGEGGEGETQGDGPDTPAGDTADAADTPAPETVDEAAEEGKEVKEGVEEEVDVAVEESAPEGVEAAGDAGADGEVSETVKEEVPPGDEETADAAAAASEQLPEGEEEEAEGEAEAEQPDAQEMGDDVKVEGEVEGKGADISDAPVADESQEIEVKPDVEMVAE